MTIERFRVSRHPYHIFHHFHTTKNSSLTKNFSFHRWKTITIKNNAALFKDIYGLFVEEVNKILDVPGITPFFALQPLSLNIIGQMQKDGGNVLGLETGEGPLRSKLFLELGWVEGDRGEEIRGKLTVF